MIRSNLPRPVKQKKNDSSRAAAVDRGDLSYIYLVTLAEQNFKNLTQQHCQSESAAEAVRCRCRNILN